MNRIRLNVQVPIGGRPGSDIRSILDLAHRAEAAGFDGIVLCEHIILGEHLEQYPAPSFGFESSSAWIDPVTTMAAVAAVTTRLNVMSAVIIAPIRAPSVFAKEIATIEQLAPGRVQVGVGIGWQSEEFSTNRVEFADRGQLLDDTMGACRALWRDAPASFTSPTLSFDRIWCEPRPPTGGPTVLFGGTLYERNVRRVVQLGDGWIPRPFSTDESIAAGVTRLRAEYEQAGRDPASLFVHAMRIATDADGRPSLTASFDTIDYYLDLGLTSLGLALPMYVPDPSGWDAWFAEAADLIARHSA
jgi:probable F420-dependent oxidoreductase